MVENPPFNAGDVGSVPGQGTKIPHAAGQLSLHVTTREPIGHNEDPVQQNKKSSLLPSMMLLGWGGMPCGMKKILVPQAGGSNL